MRCSQVSFDFVTRSLPIVLLLFACSSAAAQPACDAARLEAATGTYEVGRLAPTFDLLRPCLPDGFASRDQRVSAYRLIALSYLARDSLDEARTSVRQLLGTDSRFKPDPENDPRLFTDMVNELRPRWYTFLWRGNAWYQWAGRAVVIGGMASLPFLLGSDDPPDLPGPPPYPE